MNLNYTNMGPLETACIEGYCQEEIMMKYSDEKIKNFDTDPDKIYKLSILSKVYDFKIYDILVTLHHMKRMYGADALKKTLKSEYLLYEYNPRVYGDFGYNVDSEHFVCGRFINQDGHTNYVIIETTDYIVMPLDNLQMTLENHPDYAMKVNSFQDYASILLGFVKEFEKWSDKFIELMKTC